MCAFKNNMVEKKEGIVNLPSGQDRYSAERVAKRSIFLTLFDHTSYKYILKPKDRAVTV